MVLDPRFAPRRRDRALDRLDGFTAGAVVLGVLATAGFGTVAAMTTHVPGASAIDASGPVTSSDGTSGGAAGGTTPNDVPLPTTRPGTSGSRSNVSQQPATGVQVLPSNRSSGRRHASTGGS